jgi:hypothetical protein
MDELDRVEREAYRRGQDDGLEQVLLELDSISNRLPTEATEARVALQYVQDAVQTLQVNLVLERRETDLLMGRRPDAA